MFCDTWEEALRLVSENEVSQGVKYVVLRQEKRWEKVSSVSSQLEIFSKKNVLFESSGKQALGKKIEYDGVPYFVIGQTVLQCHQGKQRDKCKTPDQSKTDHDFRRTRIKLQTTKKIGCPSVVVLTEVLKCIDYAIQINSVSNRQEASKKIRKKLQDDPSNIKLERRVYVSIPEVESHIGHPVGLESCQHLPMDSELGHIIVEKVSCGIRTLNEMRRSLTDYVQNILFKDKAAPDIFDRRFYPSDREIINHMYLATMRHRHAACDQSNLLTLIEELKIKNPNDMFYFRPHGEMIEDSSEVHNIENDEDDMVFPDPAIDKFLFIYQSAFQKRLMHRYGNELTLIDATYKYTKWALPLFQIMVKTCVGYSCVGIFITQDETSASIAEALCVFKQNNMDWKPTHIMMDFSEAEMNAVNEVFPDCKILFCDFHREQAWERWVNTSKNGVISRRDDALKWFRSLAHVPTEAAFFETLEIFRTCDLVKEYPKLLTYMEKTWLPHHTKWCQAFRQDRFLVSVNTNNGTESHNRILKEKVLGHKTNSKLSYVVERIVEFYAKSEMVKYKLQNTNKSVSSKMYADWVPTFLRERPHGFQIHCIGNINKAKKLTSQIKPISVENKLYKVSSEINAHQFYTVNFGSNTEMPSCNCLSWKKTNYPCKHMFLIIQKEFVEWNDFPTHYRNNVFINIDFEVLGKTNSFGRVLSDITVNDLNICSLPCDSDINLTTNDNPVLTKSSTNENSLTSRNVSSIIDHGKKVAELRELARLTIDATYRIEKINDIQELINMQKTILKNVLDRVPNDNGLPEQNLKPVVKQNRKRKNRPGPKRTISERKQKCLPLPKRKKKTSSSRVGEYANMIRKHTVHVLV